MQATGEPGGRIRIGKVHVGRLVFGTVPPLCVGVVLMVDHQVAVQVEYKLIKENCMSKDWNHVFMGLRCALREWPQFILDMPAPI